MAKRTSGPMALSCIPLSFDVGLLTEQSEDDLRRRYYQNIIDRDFILEQLTGGATTKAVERDISHVLRDERGRWTNTPNAGDDAPTLSEETSPQYPTAAEAREKVLSISNKYQTEIDSLREESNRRWEEGWQRFAKGKTDFDVFNALPQEERDWIDEQSDILHDTEIAPINEKIEELEAAHKQAVWDVLRVENPVSVTLSESPALPIKKYQRTALDEQAHSVAGFISEDAWVGHVDKDVSARVRVSDFSVKFDNLDIMWAASDKGRASAHSGHRINIPSVMFGTARIAAHEIGHLIESNNDYVRHEAIAFLDRRTSGDELQSLAELSQQGSESGYENHEFSRPDDFVHPYVGKAYTDSSGEVRSTEVVAMGLENYLYDTAKLATKDPEHFDLTWDILHGNLNPHRASKAIRDISHVLRDERGRWTNTPNAGDDAPTLSEETSPLSISAMQHEVAKIMGSNNTEYIRHTEAKGVKSKKLVSLMGQMDSIISEFGKGSKKRQDFKSLLAEAKEISSSLTDDLDALRDIKVGWAEAIHEKFDLTAVRSVDDRIPWDFEGLSFVQQDLVKKSMNALGRYVSESAWRDQVPLLFRSAGFRFSSFDDVAVNLGASAGEASVLHELGHWLESDPFMGVEARSFLDRRVGDSDPVSMLSVAKDKNIEYPFDMVTQPDEFVDPYIGLVYRDISGERYGTEVLSSGLEMLHARPWELIEDEDYFRFIMGAIQPGRVLVKSANPQLRDISHVWRDYRGQWIDTPGAGDDAPKDPKKPKEASEWPPEPKPDEALSAYLHRSDMEHRKLGLEGYVNYEVAKVRWQEFGEDKSAISALGKKEMGGLYVDPNSGKTHQMTTELIEQQKRASVAMNRFFDKDGNFADGGNYRQQTKANVMHVKGVIEDWYGDEYSDVQHFYDLFENWQTTSNGTSSWGIYSMGIQMAASDLYEVPMSEFQEEKALELKGERDSLGKIIDTFSTWRFPFEIGRKTNDESMEEAVSMTGEALSVIYDRTQGWLKQSGVEQVKLYRGVMVPNDKYGELRPGSTWDTDDNVLSSWTTSIDVARQYTNRASGGEDVGLVIEQMVPAERIMSNYRTGFGVQSADEWVVIGDKGRASVRILETVDNRRKE